MPNRILEKLQTHWLFRREPQLSTPREIVGWWESRRPAYNLIVGIAGIITLSLIVVTGIISEEEVGTQFGMPDPPVLAVIGIFLYAIAANFFYTGGWVVEIALVRIWNNPGPDFGPLALALGLAFSVLVTLVPGIGAAVLNLFQIFIAPIGGDPRS